VSAPVPLEQWGGAGEPLLFAPANGYPPGSYRAILTALAGRFRVLAVRHRPLWPGSRPEEIASWHDLAADQMAMAEGQGLRQAIGVGHSLGAVTSLVAALRRPELFRALVLIEPVFLAPSWLERLAEAGRRGEKLQLPLVQTALKRRSHWPERQRAF
jgi:pimeloyl-ACP methyl ester carboxylesterase